LEIAIHIFSCKNMKESFPPTYFVLTDKKGL